MKTFSHLWKYLAEFFLEWEAFQIKVVQKIKTHFMFSTFFSENRAIYEITSKNVVEPERLQVALWRRVVCWTSKATRASARALTPTHSPTRAYMHIEICNTYCFLTATLVSWMRLRVTVYVHCLSCKFLQVLSKNGTVSVWACHLSSLQLIWMVHFLLKCLL